MNEYMNNCNELRKIITKVRKLIGPKEKKEKEESIKMDAFGNIFTKLEQEEKQDKVRLLFKNVPNMKNQNDVN